MQDPSSTCLIIMPHTTVQENTVNDLRRPNRDFRDSCLEIRCLRVKCVFEYVTYGNLKRF